jgi:hypothetical protein
MHGPRTDSHDPSGKLFTPMPERFRTDDVEQLPLGGLILTNFAAEQ